MSLSINDFSKYTNDIQVHKVKKSNLPSKVTGKHMYFIDNEDGTYSVGVSASDGTIKVCSDNTDKLQEQINVLNTYISRLGVEVVSAQNGGDANLIKETGIRFIFNVEHIPSGYHHGMLETFNLEADGFSPSNEGVVIQRFTDWYSGYVSTRAYRQEAWSEWHCPDAKIAALQEQITAISNMLIESANVE